MSKVGIIMGSKSDYPVMKDAVEILEFFEIDFEIENKGQVQKTKDSISKSNYNLIKSEEELKKLIIISKSQGILKQMRLKLI